MGQWQYKPNDAYGNLPIDRGLGVTNSRNSPATKGGNARLRNQVGDEIELWVHDITSDFKMEGTTAQSAGKRDFYPHNFTQPSFKVMGQCATNQQYNELAEFIRFTHRAAINYVQRHIDYPAIAFILDGGGYDTRRNHRGSHQGLSLLGLVPQFGRGARRFEFAPEWEFDFVVTRSRAGLMSDEQYHARQLASWSEQFQKNAKDEFARTGVAPYVDDPMTNEYDFQAGLGFGSVPQAKADDPTRGRLP